MDGCGGDLVRPDHFGGAQAATNHLIRGWGRTVYLFDSTEAISNAQTRRRGYERAMQDVGITNVEPYVLKLGIPESKASHDHIGAPWEAPLPYARRALAELEPPVPVVCADDFCAYAMYLAAEERGWRVGEQIAVTGFGDLALGEWVEPKLTTVGPYMARVARRGALLAIERAEGLVGAPLDLIIPVQLHRRESSVRATGTVAASRKIAAGIL